MSSSSSSCVELSSLNPLQQDASGVGEDSHSLASEAHTQSSPYHGYYKPRAGKHDGHSRAIKAIAMVTAPRNNRIQTSESSELPLWVCTGSSDGTAKIWRTDEQHQPQDYHQQQPRSQLHIHTLKGHRDSVRAVAMLARPIPVAPPSVMLERRKLVIPGCSFGGWVLLACTGSDDKTAKLWDCYSGAELCTFRGRSGVHAVAMSMPLTAPISYNRDVQEKEEEGEGGVFSAEQKAPKPAEFHTTQFPPGAPIAHIFICSRSGLINVYAWNGWDAIEVLRLQAHKQAITSLATATVPEGAINQACCWTRAMRTGRVHTAAAAARHAVKETASVSEASVDASSGSISAKGSISSWSDRVFSSSGLLMGALYSRSISGGGGGSKGEAAQERNKCALLVLCTGSQDCTAKVWLWAGEGSSLQLLHTLRGHRSWVVSVAAAVRLPGHRSMETWGKGDEAKSGAGADAEAGAGAALWICTAGLGDYRAKLYVWDGISFATTVSSNGRAVGAAAAAGGSGDEGDSEAKVHVLEGHSGSVDAVAMVTASGCSGCGSGTNSSAWVITGSADCTAKVWGIQSGAELFTLRGHSSTITAVAMLQQEQQQQQQQRTSMDNTTPSISSGEVDPVGFVRICTGSMDTSFKVKARRDNDLCTFRGHAHWVTAVALASVAPALLKRLPPSLLTPQHSVNRPGDDRRSRKGRNSAVLCSASGPTVKVWGWEDDKYGSLLDTVYQTNHSCVRCVALLSAAVKGPVDVCNSHSSTLWMCTGSEDKTATLYVWKSSHEDESEGDSGVGRKKGNTEGEGTEDHPGHGKSKSIQKGALQEVHVLRGHRDTVRAVAMFTVPIMVDAGQLSTNSATPTYTSSSKSLVVVKGLEKKLLPSSGGAGASVTRERTELLRICTGSEDASIMIWDGLTGERLLTLRGHQRAVTAVAVLAIPCPSTHAETTSTLAYRSASSTSTSTSVPNPKMVDRIPAGMEKARYQAVVRICSGSYDRTVKVWDGCTGAQLHTLQGHHDTITSVAMSLAPALRDHSNQSSSEGNTSSCYVKRLAPVDSISYRDGSYEPPLLICSASLDHSAKVWSWRGGRGRHAKSLSHEGHAVTTVAMVGIPHQSRRQRRVGAHNADDADDHGPLHPHAVWVFTGSTDCTIKVWDSTSGGFLRVIRCHEKAVMSLACINMGLPAGTATGGTSVATAAAAKYATESSLLLCTASKDSTVRLHSTADLIAFHNVLHSGAKLSPAVEPSPAVLPLLRYTVRRLPSRLSVDAQRLLSDPRIVRSGYVRLMLEEDIYNGTRNVQRLFEQLSSVPGAQAVGMELCTCEGMLQLLMTLPRSRLEPLAVTPLMKATVARLVTSRVVLHVLLLDFITLSCMLPTYNRTVWELRHKGYFAVTLLAMAMYSIFRDVIITGRMMARRNLLVSWLTEIWTIVNICSIVFIILILPLALFGGHLIQNPGYRVVASVGAGVLWMKVLGFIRVFRVSFATFVLALLQIGSDIRSFLVILLVVMAAFGNMIYLVATSDMGVSGRSEDSKEVFRSFPETLLSMFRIMIGDFDRDWFDMGSQVASSYAVVIFVVYIVVVMILMLNMLIAVVSDSYDNAVTKAQRLFMRSRLELLASIDRVVPFSHSSCVPMQINFNRDYLFWPILGKVQDSMQLWFSRIGILNDSVTMVALRFLGIVWLCFIPFMLAKDYVLLLFMLILQRPSSRKGSDTGDADTMKDATEATKDKGAGGYDNAGGRKRGAGVRKRHRPGEINDKDAGKHVRVDTSSNDDDPDCKGRKSDGISENSDNGDNDDEDDDDDDDDDEEKEEEEEEDDDDEGDDEEWVGRALDMERRVKKAVGAARATTEAHLRRDVSTVRGEVAVVRAQLAAVKTDVAAMTQKLDLLITRMER